MLNPIQLDILTLLLRSESLRYSQAKPEDIDSDSYNYHLKYLIKTGYVIKDKTNYMLSNKGKEYVQIIDSTGKIQTLFKVSVLCYVTRMNRKKHEILMHKRLRHPYFGDIDVISGKVHIGEKIEEAAKRKCIEETGLTATFKLIGVHRKVRRDKNNRVIEDTLYHVCYSENAKGNVIEKNEFGENLWMKFSSAIMQQSKNITNSKQSLEVLRRIHRKDFSSFYRQEDITLVKY